MSWDGDYLGVAHGFNDTGEIEIEWAEGGFASTDWMTVNQVKNLMSHLQRALDEHGVYNEQV